jgi:hypothetical protein
MARAISSFDFGGSAAGQPKPKTLMPAIKPTTVCLAVATRSTRGGRGPTGHRPTPTSQAPGRRESFDKQKSSLLAPVGGRIDWHDRPKRNRTETARRTIWQSVDGRFRVVKSKSLFGLSTLFYAMRRERINGISVWSIVGRHRKRQPAFQTCERANGNRNAKRNDKQLDQRKGRQRRRKAV